MKRILSLIVLTSVVAFSGCTASANSPEGTWDSIIKAAEEKNCGEFKKHITERFKMTENDCATAFKAFTDNGFPEIKWSETQYSDENATAKVYLENGRSLTTFLKQADGNWQADTKFWR